MAEVTLIGKPNCHLCDDMKAVIAEVCTPRGDVVRELSIEEYPELAEKYWEEIPVVLVNDKRVAFWRVTKEQLLAALTASPHSQRSAAFFDLDNTLIRGSSLFYLARGLFKLKFFSAKDWWQAFWKQAKFVVVGKEHVSDMQAIKRQVLKIAGGHSVSRLMEIADGVVEDYLLPKVYQQVVDLAKVHLQRGEEVWICTAAPNRLANALAHKLGFTGALGTVAEEVDGYFTGELVGPIVHGQEKANAVSKLAADTGLDLSLSSAYSDSINDLPLLTLVGNPSAVNADRALRLQAKRNGWRQYDFRKMRLARRYGVHALAASALGLLIRRRPSK